MCEFCDREIGRTRSGQKHCGEHACRLASKRKYYGVTFTCDACGNEEQKKRSNQRFCSSSECQRVSKQGVRPPKHNITCPYCNVSVVARNTRQITCLSDVCKEKHARLTRNRCRDRKRTGELFTCLYCSTMLERIQSNQVTCGKPNCRKMRKRARDDETFWMLWRESPKLCEVCERPIRVKRFRLHPKCRRRRANDKKRLNRNRIKLTAAKIEAFRQQRPPRPKDQVSRRMEELKCVSNLQRMF